MPEELSLRVHRALSWLNCAEQHGDDPDSRFIFLWISVNAAYAQDLYRGWTTAERKLLSSFLDSLLAVDEDGHIARLVWREYPGSIRLLIENRYLYQQFWDFQNGQLSEDTFNRFLSRSRRAANRALGNQDTRTVLSIACERLYMLRNQLVHGGATWGGSVNREQIRDACNLMSRMVPLLLEIMLTRQPKLPGRPCFPVIR